MKERNNNMKNNTSKAFVFDFDETLAHTQAIEVENSLDRFIEFKNPNDVLNGKPLPLMKLAKEVYDEGHSVFVLTARNNCVENAITKFMQRHGIKAKAVHCVGFREDMDIAQSKRTVLMTIIENHEVVYFFDDNKVNVQEANKLEGLKAKLS